MNAKAGSIEKVSIIIATYNGAEKIAGVLNALLTQHHKDFEVVVVVDGSTDNTLEVIDPYRLLFPNMKVVEQPNKGRSAVRNKGVKEAVGNVLIFYDDDMIPSHDSVLCHVRFHRTMTGLVSGNIVELEEVGKTDIENYKAYLTRKWTEKYKEGITQLTEGNLFFTAANSSVRREVFDSLGGFDERLTDAEDFDLSYRALKSNVSVSFDKSNVAVHRQSITCISYIKRLRAYTDAHQKLRSFYPERSSSRKTDSMAPFKGYLYGLFSFAFWPRLIDRQAVRFLPKRVRYKFYDVVIESLGVRNITVPL